MSFATEAVVELLVKSVVFEPVRKFVSRVNWFKQLFSCGYCMSVWVAAAAVACVPVAVMPLSDFVLVNILATTLVVHRLSNVMHNVIDKWTDKYYDMRFVNTDKGEEN
jgi:ABC-type iron transport system FetAB permease component